MEMIFRSEITENNKKGKIMNAAVPLGPFSDSLISKDAEDKPEIQSNIDIYIIVLAFSRITLN